MAVLTRNPLPLKPMPKVLLASAEAGVAAVCAVSRLSALKEAPSTVAWGNRPGSTMCSIERDQHERRSCLGPEAFEKNWCGVLQQSCRECSAPAISAQAAFNQAACGLAVMSYNQRDHQCRSQQAHESMLRICNLPLP